MSPRPQFFFESVTHILPLTFPIFTVTSLAAGDREVRSSMEKLEEARFLENEKWIAFYDARWALDRARLEVSRQTGTLIAALR